MKHAIRDRGRLQLLDDGSLPAEFTPANSSTHNLLVHSYYVAQTSDLMPGVPTLRRKTLTSVDAKPIAAVMTRGFALNARLAVKGIQYSSRELAS